MTRRSLSKDDGPRAFSLHPKGTGDGLTYDVTTSLFDATSQGGSGHETLYLGSLVHVIDRLQELFDVWEAQGTFSNILTPEALSRARLAVHEWVANLVQHADFEDRAPEISLSVWEDDGRLRIVITDNSSGFDPGTWTEGRLDEVVQRLPDRGMGLLLVRACVEELCYACLLDDPHNRLELSIAA